MPSNFERAPAESDYIYAVVNGLNIYNSSESEDSTTFYIDVYANETSPPEEMSSTEELESVCDDIRTQLQNEIIYLESELYAHIGFENLIPVTENEYDLTHRRLTFSAKIFYIGG